METQRKEFQKHQAGLYSAIINHKRIFRLERVGFQWKDQNAWNTQAAHKLWVTASLCKNLFQQLTLGSRAGFSTAIPCNLFVHEGEALRLGLPN